MHPNNPRNPNLMQLASQTQNMAASTKQERLAMAIQMVLMVSGTVMASRPLPNSSATCAGRIAVRSKVGADTQAMPS